MRKKDISDAIGNINDRYIEEAADFQRKKKRTGKSSILQKSVAAAAPAEEAPATEAAAE